MLWARCPLELGSAHFDQRDHNLAAKRAVRQLETLGYQVSLTQGVA